MKLNILILEDDPSRQSIFHKKLKEHRLTITNVALEAIALLQTETFDVAYLDHDLNGPFSDITGVDNPTGAAVAHWISNNKDSSPEAIFLHAHDGAGVEDMSRVLPNAIRAPFPECITKYKLKIK
tara:strand:- start:47 stop:421 length:375 start_codon:yes stop_codon:yes gene_type:complete